MGRRLCSTKTEPPPKKMMTRSAAAAANCLDESVRSATSTAVPSCSPSTAEPQRPEPPSSPAKCAICLGDLANRCYTNSCIHQFCFGCLLEWSRIKAECPLCKSNFQSIYHNIRTNDDYDEYHIPSNMIPHLSIRLQAADPNIYAAPSVPAPEYRRFAEPRIPFPYSLSSGPTSPFHDHGYSFQRLVRDRERSERMASSTANSYIRILEVGPVSEPRALDFMGINSAGRQALDNPFYTEEHELFGTLEESARVDPQLRGYQVRKRIYDRSQYVQPLESALPPGTVFFPSVEYFRTHPASLGRISGWLYREIMVLMGMHRSRTEMGYVFDVIFGLLLRFDIRSREFREMVNMHFGTRTRHFQHEFYHFVLTGMRMEEYDRVATYTVSSSSGTSTTTSTATSGLGSPGPSRVITITISDSEPENDFVEQLIDVGIETNSNSSDSQPKHLEIRRSSSSSVLTASVQSSSAAASTHRRPLRISPLSSSRLSVSPLNVSRHNPGTNSYSSYHLISSDDEDLFLSEFTRKKGALPKDVESSRVNANGDRRQNRARRDPSSSSSNRIAEVSPYCREVPFPSRTGSSVTGGPSWRFDDTPTSREFRAALWGLPPRAISTNRSTSSFAHMPPSDSIDAPRNPSASRDTSTLTSRDGEASSAFTSRSMLDSGLDRPCCPVESGTGSGCLYSGYSTAPATRPIIEPSAPVQTGLSVSTSPLRLSPATAYRFRQLDIPSPPSSTSSFFWGGISRNSLEPPSPPFSGSSGFFRRQSSHADPVTNVNPDGNPRRVSFNPFLEINRPPRLTLNIDQPKKSEQPPQTIDSDSDEVEMLGIHPIIKPPPLAVITLSSDDENEKKPEVKDNQHNFIEEISIPASTAVIDTGAAYLLRSRDVELCETPSSQHATSVLLPSSPLFQFSSRRSRASAAAGSSAAVGSVQTEPDTEIPSTSNGSSGKRKKSLASSKKRSSKSSLTTRAAQKCVKKAKYSNSDFIEIDDSSCSETESTITYSGSDMDSDFLKIFASRKKKSGKTKRDSRLRRNSTKSSLIVPLLRDPLVENHAAFLRKHRLHTKGDRKSRQSLNIPLPRNRTSSSTDSDTDLPLSDSPQKIPLSKTSAACSENSVSRETPVISPHEDSPSPPPKKVASVVCVPHKSPMTSETSLPDPGIAIMDLRKILEEKRSAPKAGSSLSRGRINGTIFGSCRIAGRRWESEDEDVPATEEKAKEDSDSEASQGIVPRAGTSRAEVVSITHEDSPLRVSFERFISGSGGGNSETPRSAAGISSSNSNSRDEVNLRSYSNGFGSRFVLNITQPSSQWHVGPPCYGESTRRLNLNTPPWHGPRSTAFDAEDDPLSTTGNTGLDLSIGSLPPISPNHEARRSSSSRVRSTDGDYWTEDIDRWL